MAAPLLLAPMLARAPRPGRERRRRPPARISANGQLSIRVVRDGLTYSVHAHQRLPGGRLGDQIHGSTLHGLTYAAASAAADRLVAWDGDVR